jgi:uncharacterized repeat protein (TIGR01451 family)
MAIAVPADAIGLKLIMNAVEDPPNRFCVGNTIHYTLEVENPLDSKRNLTLNVYDTYPNGTTEQLEANLFLAVGDKKTYNRSYVVEAGDVGKRIRNRLLANGTDETGALVSFSMNMYSLILDPKISITKVASPTSGAPCTNVNFTITVNNTGDCTLDLVTVVDTLPSGMSYVSDNSGGNVSGQEITWNLGSMGPGPTTILLVAHIDVGAAGTLTNNVTATGTPKDSMCGHINDTVMYCYNVTNTGDVTLTNVTVKDNIYGSVTVGTTTLAPGESTLGTVTHISLPAWWKGGEEGER